MILLYFAWVREQIGTDSETLTPPAEVATVAALLDWLATRSPAHAGALADRGRIRVALDDEFASPDSPVSGVQEVAIFPPVTGG
jgi:molybdopterin synthase sulfur carrier subunit